LKIFAIKIYAKDDFYVFVPSDLEISSFDLKFALPVTRVQGHVPTNLKFLQLF